MTSGNERTVTSPNHEAHPTLKADYCNTGVQSHYESFTLYNDRLDKKMKVI
jgi:hypothetical protein